MYNTLFIRSLAMSLQVDFYVASLVDKAVVRWGLARGQLSPNKVFI